MTSRDLDTVVRQIHREIAEDYVGIWEIYRVLDDGNGVSPEQIALVVERLLQDPDVKLGQFAEGTFRPWSEDSEIAIKRLQHQLEALGRAPDIGEIAWLSRS